MFMEALFKAKREEITQMSIDFWVFMQTKFKAKREGTTQMSIDFWVFMQTMLYPYHGFLFSYNMKWSSDMYWNMNDRWKKLDCKEHIL